MATISLCMIVGNVEEYIERCLSSFAPIADEICVVRAIGCLEPDRTLDIASEKFGARIAEYKNAEGHEDWPHVDNFAAARQMSFDMATGDYCFWCDSDDILKAGAERIRRHANEGSYACYLFAYDIFGKNVVVNRERMMRKEAGRWMYPVHECFKFHVEPVTGAQDDGVVIQHLPNLDKTGSNDRNLRILEAIPDADMTPGLRYHMFGELMGADRKREAVELGVKLLEENVLGRDERYDLLLSLVLQTPDANQRLMLLHEAFKTDPTRRESLGVLSCEMMDVNKPAESLAYARQMAATLPPEDHSWNSRRSFYGYIGDDICQQALRVNQRMAEADLLRRKALEKAGGARIALLHATRGRPVQASKCRKLWHDLAEKPEQIEHIFAFDEDDKESYPLGRFHHIVVPAGGGCVRAWNCAAGISEAPVMVQLSDDWVPVPNWDKLILERIGDVKQPRVLAISDGVRKDDLLCMAICTREYYYQDWFLFHPRFKGVYSDNFFTHTAYQRNQVIAAKDIVFTHQHPAFDDRVEVDATYTAQNSPERYAEGRFLFAELLLNRDWSSVPGFFNYWPFYDYVAGQLKDGDTAVEVGVWFGRSLIYLAQACQRLGKRVRFVAVDNFSGEADQPAHAEIVAAHGGSIRAAFEANLKRCGVDDLVEIIQGDSATSAQAMADSSAAFVFVDAAHDYDSVKRDVAAWLPKVRPDGIFAGHDAQHEPVMRAVRELIPKARMMFGILWVK